ncbi:MAG: hypothetical protein QNL33_14915 [Akkermansiaceae bacterium]
MSQDQLSSEGRQEVRFPSTGKSKSEDVDRLIYEPALDQGGQLAADFQGQFRLIETAQRLGFRQAGARNPLSPP